MPARKIHTSPEPPPASHPGIALAGLCKAPPSAPTVRLCGTVTHQFYRPPPARQPGRAGRQVPVCLGRQSWPDVERRRRAVFDRKRQRRGLTARPRLNPAQPTHRIWTPTGGSALERVTDLHSQMQVRVARQAGRGGNNRRPQLVVPWFDRGHLAGGNLVMIRRLLVGLQRPLRSLAKSEWPAGPRGSKEHTTACSRAASPAKIRPLLVRAKSS